MAVLIKKTPDSHSNFYFSDKERKTLFVDINNSIDKHNDKDNDNDNARI